ncbi:hypothetical protein LCGC14_1574710 [marine sediment metagenome]|uniref:Uncharacterized protein n=1 Tax=marine sediment metagenome TaxID=412755 RepID=A0A0F9J4V1_9ZZZZ
MGLKRVTGNSKKTQKLVDIEIVSALKGSNQSNPRSGGITLVTTPEVAPTVRAEHHNTENVHFVVSGQTTSTNMPAKSTGNAMEKSVRGTSEQLMLMEYQNTTSCVRDFLARAFQSLDIEVGLPTYEEHYSLRYAESLGLKELRIYSLKMLKDSSPTTMEIPSKPFSERWMNWGTTANGRCLTARITESRKTGKGCSLSDILEDKPDPKYFLSEKQMKYLKGARNW